MGYIGGVVGATAAANAAAEKRRQMLGAEEEDMTQYTQDALTGNWEFKIVRSDSGAFRKPEVLRRLVEEEARAGWVMLEKFDDSRVRFKRPRSARAQDAFLPEGVDPYRTRYGAFATRQATVVGVMIGLVLFLGLGVAGLFLAERGAPATGPVVVAPLILVVLGFVALLLMVLFRRGLR
jgi:hypothetical protein